MLTIVATIAGVIALFGQGYDLPDQFVNGALNRGAPVIEAHFVGLEWDCAPKSERINETCFAGIATRKGVSFLHTGP
jgi:hypothetical protein